MIKKYTEIFIKAVYGGSMVSLGGFAFISSENKYVGAFIFTLGLFTICEFGFELFTGRVGYALFKPILFVMDLIVILLGNFAGCFAVSCIAAAVKPELVDAACKICSVKLNENVFQNFALGFLCGVMMFIAVEAHKTKSSPAKYIGMFLAVPLFIICGFEHSVANMFYFMLAGVPWKQLIAFSAVTVLGNAAGSIAFSLYKFYDKKL